MRADQHTANKSGLMNLQDLILQLFAAHGWKAAIGLVLSFIGQFLLPISPFIAIGTGLVVCDFITGITASLYTAENITSKRMGRTLMKVIFYSLAIIIVYAVEMVFFKNSMYLVYLIAVYISLIELYSNLENIGRITGTDVATVIKMAINTRFKNIIGKTDANGSRKDQDTTDNQ